MEEALTLQGVGNAIGPFVCAVDVALDHAHAYDLAETPAEVLVESEYTDGEDTKIGLHCDLPPK